MPIIIPARADAQLRASKEAGNKFNAAVNRTRNTWTPDQQEQLGHMYQVLKETHDALVNIVEANR